MTACALPRFMFTWVPSGNVRLTPESMSQDSDRGAGLSVAIGRNRLPESSDKGGIGSPMPSCRQSRRRFLASFTDSPLFSIHRFILPCLTLHLFRKEVRVAVGLWDSSFKNAFHTLSVSVSAMLVSMRQKNIAQVSILERYFFVSTYQAAGPDTCLAVFVVASLPPCL